MPVRFQPDRYRRYQLSIEASIILALGQAMGRRRRYLFHILGVIASAGLLRHRQLEAFCRQITALLISI